MRIKEELIAKAIKAIEIHGISKNGHVANEFKGYIDTFAASIVHNGLIPAIIFFQSSSKEKRESTNDPGKGKTHKNRKKLLQAILSLLLVEKKDGSPDNKYITLFDFVKNRNEEDKKKIRQDIVEATIALKLALRTFEFI